jgi:hypothetical protein
MSEHWRAVARVGDVKKGDVLAVEIDGVQMVVGQKLRPTSFLSFLVSFLVALLASACSAAPSSRPAAAPAAPIVDVRTAPPAEAPPSLRYDAALEVVLGGISDATRPLYPNFTTSGRGLVTAWHQVKHRGLSPPHFVRFEITLIGRRPWQIDITPHVAIWAVGQSVPVELAPADHPVWVFQLADALAADIHQRLLPYGMR